MRFKKFAQLYISAFDQDVVQKFDVENDRVIATYPMGDGKSTPDHSSQTMSRAQRTLKAWAMTKASAGLPLPTDSRSLNLVSSPMLTKARAKNQLR